MVKRITKNEFRLAGGFCNPRVFRRQHGLFWRYYKVT